MFEKTQKGKVFILKIVLHSLLFIFFSVLEDKLEQQHAIFTQYRDPCRLGPGEDKPWALGESSIACFHVLLPSCGLLLTL